MPRPDLILSSERVVTPAGVTGAVVHVRDGVIRKVEPREAGRLPPGAEELGDLVLMPGIIDCHVHINDPGRSDWEGFETAGRAAAAGGITTLIDMPLNSSPVTTSPDALAEKVGAADGRCMVDYGFWGGVVPGNREHLGALLQAGVLGFKCFLLPSGIGEFAHVTAKDLRPAMEVLAALDAVLLVHAELHGPIDSVAADVARLDPREYATFLASRPAEAEIEAVRLMIELCRETGCAVHVVHVSAAAVLALLSAARHSGLPITAETCPHYLRFADGDIPRGATEFKCAPPIRGEANREALWSAMAEGVLDLVASDHSPCPPALKRREDGDFMDAWGGISSLQLGLSLMWTGAERRGFELTDLVRWMCTGPAGLAGLSGRKGAIAVGADADLVVWDPEADFTVRGGELHHRHALTPYEGAVLRGTVRTTYLRGEPVFDGGEFRSVCSGQWIKRGP